MTQVNIERKTMSKIIVTGSEGFVAGPTIKEIEKKGWEWVGVDLKEGKDICKKEDWQEHAKKCDVPDVHVLVRDSRCVEDILDHCDVKNSE